MLCYDRLCHVMLCMYVCMFVCLCVHMYTITSVTSSGGGACRCCSESFVRGSPYCQSHKKDHQNLYMRCMKKNKDGSFVDPAKAEQYEEIFGPGRDGPPSGRGK